MKKRIYSVLVENRSGVLTKVAGLFARRMYNIDSLAVGETDDPAPISSSVAVNDEMDELLTALRERKDLRMLFSLARDASPEDVRQAARIIEALRRED